MYIPMYASGLLLETIGQWGFGFICAFFYVFMVNDSKKGHQLFWRYEEIFLPPLEKPEMTSLLYRGIHCSHIHAYSTALGKIELNLNFNFNV